MKQIILLIGLIIMMILAYFAVVSRVLEGAWR
jgi:hypothetical protein